MTDTLKPAELDLEALKPCPFCGGCDVVPSQVTSCGGWGVLCRGCHAYQDTRAEAITEALATWNRRAPDPRIEALEAERDEARARLRNVPGLTPFNDAEDAAWPLAMARLQNTEPGPDQGIAMVGTGDLELALRRLSQFADVALRNAAVIGGLEARALSAEAQRDRMREALEPFAAAAGDIRPDDADTMRPAIVQAVHFRRAAKVVSALSQGSGEEG